MERAKKSTSYVRDDPGEQPSKSTQTSGLILVLGGLLVFSPLIDGGTTHLPVLIVRLVLLGALTAWILLSMKPGRFTVYRNRLFLPIAAFVGWAALSVFRSPYTAVSQQWLVSILSYVVMLFLVLQLVESTSQVRWLVKVVLGMGLFEASIGMYQGLWLGQTRATGTFFNANFFAAYEVAVFAVVFGLLCFDRQQEGSGPWEKVFLSFTGALVCLAFVLAQSRGALAGLVIAVAFIGISRYGKAFLAVLLVLLLGGATIPNPLQNRILNIGSQDRYAFTRVDIWKSSVQRIVDHPWGQGMGLYKYSSFQYRFPIENEIARYGKRAESAHNEYLQMAVELGVVGLVIFFVGLCYLGREIWETLTCDLRSWERGLVTGLTGGILGLLVHAAVDSVFHEPALVLLLIMFSVLILIVKRLRKPESLSWLASFSFHPARAVLIGILATLLSLLIIRPAAGWYAFENGDRAMAAGRVDRALTFFQWATWIDPGTSAYHDAVARTEMTLYRQSGELSRLLNAASELKVGLEMNPLDGRLANRLGGLFVLLAERENPGTSREAMLEQAAGYYQQAIRLDPYSPFNRLELGKLRWAQGLTEEAEACFRRATIYEPNFLPARVHLAELLLATGGRAEAASEYAQIVKIKDRYHGQVLTSLEREYLEVGSEHIKSSLAATVVQ